MTHLLDIYTWNHIFNLCSLEDKYRLSATCKEFRQFLYNMNSVKLHQRMRKVSITCLKNLRNLKCYSYPITNELISNMTTLVKLDCGLQSRLTDDGIMKLTNMRTLKCETSHITASSVKYLRNLESLSCGRCYIDDNGLSYLQNLRKLNCCVNSFISDIGLSYVPHLKKLHCGWNNIITDAGITCLTELEYLNIGENIKINFNAIFHHPTLKTLVLRKRTITFTDKELKQLHKKFDMYLV